MSDNTLEHRYRFLLRAYPAGFRRDRGDELIETLLSVETETRRWPAPHQSLALLLGGLRARWAIPAPPTDRTWWQAAELSALAVTGYGLAIAAVQAKGVLLELRRGGYLVSWFAQDVTAVALLAALLLALLAGLRRSAVALAVAAVVIPTWLSPQSILYNLDDPEWWAPIVAGSAAVALLTRPARLPGLGHRARLVMLGGVAGAVGLALASLPGTPRPLILMLAVLVLAIPYATVDPRVTVTAAALLLPAALSTVSDVSTYPAVLDFSAPLASLRALIAVAVLGFAAVSIRRQALI
jgi:hypothetical protein